MAFVLKDNRWMLAADGASALDLSELVKTHARPFYLYDMGDAMMRADHFLRSELSVHFAMKANSYPRLLREFARRDSASTWSASAKCKRRWRAGSVPSA